MFGAHRSRPGMQWDSHAPESRAARQDLTNIPATLTELHFLGRMCRPETIIGDGLNVRTGRQLGPSANCVASVMPSATFLLQTAERSASFGLGTEVCLLESSLYRALGKANVQASSDALLWVHAQATRQRVVVAVAHQ